MEVLQSEPNAAEIEANVRLKWEQVLLAMNYVMQVEEGLNTALNGIQKQYDRIQYKGKAESQVKIQTCDLLEAH